MKEKLLRLLLFFLFVWLLELGGRGKVKNYEVDGRKNIY